MANQPIVFEPHVPCFSGQSGALPFSPMAWRVFSDSGSIADHRVRWRRSIGRANR
jgi:hypothetical protein